MVMWCFLNGFYNTLKVILHPSCAIIFTNHFFDWSWRFLQRLDLFPPHYTKPSKNQALGGIWGEGQGEEGGGVEGLGG